MFPAASSTQVSRQSTTVNQMLGVGHTPWVGIYQSPSNGFDNANQLFHSRVLDCPRDILNQGSSGESDIERSYNLPTADRGDQRVDHFGVRLGK
jgi:hypothetical protein